MKNLTRKLFNAYLENQASINGVEDTSQRFTVDPTVSQRLFDHVQQSADILPLCNFQTVDEQTGESIGMGISGHIASRTNTKEKKRETKDVHTLDSFDYKCQKTDFDTHIGFALLDRWAKFPDFELRVRDKVTKQESIDVQTILFHGESVADNSNLSEHPLLQDVGIGIFQHLRNQSPQRIMSSGKVDGEIRIGLGNAEKGYGDYSSIDQAVQDMRGNFIQPWFKNRTDFSVMCGSLILDDKYHAIENSAQKTPTETEAFDRIAQNKKAGGLRALSPNNMPDRSMFVTFLSPNDDSNISILNQEGTRRRLIKEEADWDRVEFYNSVNFCVHLEDLGAAAAMTNIKLWDPVLEEWY